MKVFEAPESVVLSRDDIVCFLAGGITDCSNWQEEVIECLRDYDDLDTLCLFNPRRENFDIKKDDPMEQIKWEFYWLNRMDLFSMYFANSSTSVQPICMYELGRYLERMRIRFYGDYKKRVTIGIEDGYSRANDVKIQSELALENKNYIENITPERHAEQIRKMYLSVTNKFVEF